MGGKERRGEDKIGGDMKGQRKRGEDRRRGGAGRIEKRSEVREGGLGGGGDDRNYPLISTVIPKGKTRSMVHPLLQSHTGSRVLSTQ